MKTEKGYAILMKTGHDDNFTLYINPAMRKYFNFPYDDENGRITFDKTTFPITIVGTDEYYYIETESTNNLLFPFNKIVFMCDSEIPVKKYHIFNNLTKSSISQQSILLSYDLNISNLDEIGNSINYVDSNGKSRSLSLTSQRLNQFELFIYLVTRDGLFYQLKLDEGELVAISMLFYAQ